MRTPDSISYAAVPVARLGISLVFLWFGVNQLLFPSDFMGYLSDYLLQMESAEMFVIFNGLFETIAGTLLLLGIFTRPVALILSLHLLVIAASLGYNDISVRDTGIAIVAFALFLAGPDRWSCSALSPNRAMH